MASTGTVIETHAGHTDHTILTTPVTELVAGNDVNLITTEWFAKEAIPGILAIWP